MKTGYIAAIDQGTTSTRFMLFNHDGEPVASQQLEHEQIMPQQGWVEQNPMEILENTKKVIEYTIVSSKIQISKIHALGITNQRETTIVWNKYTGQPYYNAICWMDNRTSDICKQLLLLGTIKQYQSITGLILNPYFSGTKLKWIIENVESVKADMEKDEILFGTVDSWLIWNLTGGINGGIHVTDHTNASRTFLYNLHTQSWDTYLLNLFGIKPTILPKILPSSFNNFGRCKQILNGVPICSILGDQQAALFGQCCFNPGDCKNTYGTGCFLLMNTGLNPIISESGLLATVGYKIGDEPTVYAIEGSVAIAGALITWLKENMGIIKKSEECEAMARKVDNNDGIIIVPAFSGLMAPYWRNDARGIIIGLTQYSNKYHVVRAALESVALQTRDVFETMKQESKLSLNTLKADGGMTHNSFLMQYQADILKTTVVLSTTAESTSRGAVFAAGLACGFFSDLNELVSKWKCLTTYKPSMKDDEINKIVTKWNIAISRTFDWMSEK